MFTYQQTNFVNRKTYNERTHADALYGGVPNFINDGLEYNPSTSQITNGKGINGGLPFVLGRSGEFQDVTSSFTGFLVVKTTLNDGVASVTELLELASIPANTDTIKYFGIYKLSNGNIVEDRRHIEYIKSVEIISISSDEFAIAINGTISNTFTTSAISQGYIKIDAEQRFAGSWKPEDLLVDSSNAHYFGMNATETIHELLEAITTKDLYIAYKKKFIVISVTKADNFNLHNAFKQLLIKNYDYSTDASFYISYEFENQSFIAPHEMTIRVNGTNKIFKFTCDNYGADYLTLDEDFFRVPELHVDKVIQNSLSGTGTAKERELLLFSGNIYMRDGQEIALNLHGYNMSDYANLMLVWSRYDEATSVDTNIVTQLVHNHGSTFGYDGFYDTQGMIAPRFVGQTETDTFVIKHVNLNSDGTLFGRSASVAPHDSMVLRSVYGNVSQEAYHRSNIFNKVTPLTKNLEVDIMSKYKLIETMSIPKDVDIIYLATPSLAYDIYEFNAVQMQEFEKDFSEMRGNDQGNNIIQK